MLWKVLKLERRLLVGCHNAVESVEIRKVSIGCREIREVIIGCQNVVANLEIRKVSIGCQNAMESVEI